ncbi:MAG: ChaN family lipoprotein [Pseudomonadota bacterium]
MPRFRPQGLCAALAGAAALLAAAAAAQPEIRRLPGGERLPDMAALAELARAHDLVVMGEIHDNPRHQASQAELAARAGVSALAFEMIPRAAEDALAELRAGPRTEAAREAAQWSGYPAYHVVLAAAPQVPVAGAGLPREALRRAIREKSAAAAFEGDAALYGLDAPLPAEAQAALEAELAEAHCGALPDEMLPGMAKAQRLRDAAFAAALLRARDRAAGQGPAMLVTGNGHARTDRGAPAFLARVAPSLSVLSIGQIERAGPSETWREALARWTAEDGRPLFDIVIVTDPEPREDPCARFGEKG